MPAERHRLWSRLPPVPEPTPEQLARVQQRVEERIRARKAHRLRWAPGLLFGLGLLWWLLSLRTPAPVPQQLARPGTIAAFDAKGTGPVAAPLAALPLEQPAAPATQPAVERPAAPARRALRAPAIRDVQQAARAPSASSQKAPASEPGELGVDADDAEARLLGQAIARLRQAHDPQGALAALATYRAAFPHGALRGEAMLVQAESLVRLGRQQELVAMLAPEVVADSPRSIDLELLRAEALANLERCSEAILIFNAILSPGDGDAPVAARLRQRALHGRALCRMHNGQLAAARRDLELEEDEFPEETEKVHRTLRGIAGQP